MLKILHVLRSPVGGLFRHVIDLARAQAARGHQIGIVADSSTGGARADAAFELLKGQLALAGPILILDPILLPRLWCGQLGLNLSDDLQLFF